MAKSRAGRRPGTSTTREAIAAAAREQFAGVGYERTTMRSVAGAAGVDPALVIHYFGSKQRLFTEVMHIPFDPEPVIQELLRGGRRGLGERLARYLHWVFESPGGAMFVGRLRASVSDPDAAVLLRDRIRGELVGPLIDRMGVDRADLRAALVSSQLIGWVVVRAVLGVDAVRGLTADDFAAAIGPTLQRYLVGDLGLDR